MKRAPNQPISGEVVLYGGCFVKQMFVPDAGTLIPQHSHTWDHLSALCQGAVQVWRDGEDVGVFAAPALIKIPARCKHAFLTLTKNVSVLCIHSQREGEEAIPVHEEHQLELEG